MSSTASSQRIDSQEILPSNDQVQAEDSLDSAYSVASDDHPLSDRSDLVVGPNCKTVDTRDDFYVPEDVENTGAVPGPDSVSGKEQLRASSKSSLKHPVDATLVGGSAFTKLGTNWPIAIWIGVVHILALIAPFYFTWPALAMCAILIFCTASMGVCMGYHRLLTHRSFKTYRPIRWLLAILGGLSGEGSALTWVAQHRRHHVYSDHEGDPHSPKDGSWWSHMLWFLPDFGRKWHHDLLSRYAPDIMKDRVMVWIHRMFLPSHFLLGGALFAIGYFCNFWGLGGTRAGMSMLLWGLGVRMVYVLHTTWFVNSVTHIWGYRNYDTSDNSRNLWWVSLATFGEGWHNNHHAYQQVASQGHHWWEIDITYWMILLMEKLGLAWDIVRIQDVPKPYPHQ